MEIHAGLKARGLMMVHIFHPLLLVAKDKSLGFKLLDQGPFIRKLKGIAQRMQDDPRFVILALYSVCARARGKHWQVCVRGTIWM